MSAWRQVPHWLLFLWVYSSISIVFSLLMWQQSTGAGLNIYDALITLPALLVLAPLMLQRGWIGKGFLYASAPLAAYLAFTVVSLTWATSPDLSKTFRAFGQLIGLFVFFSYLQLSGNVSLLRRALFSACVVTALLGTWHLIVMYGVLGTEWKTVLYQGIGSEKLAQYGVKPINTMLATLLIAPQAAMLLGLTLREKHVIFRSIGYLALTALMVFLISLERRTGQVAAFVAIAACIVLYRNRIWYVLLGVAIAVALFVLIFSPDFILSRGFSWRPAIWMSTLDAISNAPIFGHGITNTVTPVVVYDHAGTSMGTFHHPHNMPLAVTYYLGVVGLLLWLLLWVPGAIGGLCISPERQKKEYVLLPMLVGVSALLFDGGNPFSPFHFNWFCFWIPAMLIISSQAVEGQHLFDDRCKLRIKLFFSPPYQK